LTDPELYLGRSLFASPTFFLGYYTPVAGREPAKPPEAERMKPKGNAWDPTVPPEESPYNHKGEPVLKRRFVGEGASLGKRVPTLIDLFSGAGGFSLGFERAGFKTILGLDVHRAAAETFMRNFPEAGFVLGDARRVSVGLVLEATAGVRPDVITAGVANCHPFCYHPYQR
jgi:hypothetical protein